MYMHERKDEDSGAFCTAEDFRNLVSLRPLYISRSKSLNPRDATSFGFLLLLSLSKSSNRVGLLGLKP